MGFLDLFKGKSLPAAELARRLGVDLTKLRDSKPVYREFLIPKRSGGERRIFAPAPPLKDLQCRILRKLFDRLKAHPAATGFERGRSIVTNALPHAGQAVTVSMDVRNFFTATKAERIEEYLKRLGWNRESRSILLRLLTHKGGLPQGAPTSPRLSNLVNYRLDVRLESLGRKLGARYSRYADDLAFSFAKDQSEKIHALVRGTRVVLEDFGYELHQRKKLRIRRRHQKQLVTGLVVNSTPKLPRSKRRWLRAIEHRVRKGKRATLTPAQLGGWRALQSMIVRQSAQVLGPEPSETRYCPNCSAKLERDVTACWNCLANFGPGSAWAPAEKPAGVFEPWPVQSPSRLSEDRPEEQQPASPSRAKRRGRRDRIGAGFWIAVFVIFIALWTLEILFPESKALFRFLGSLLRLAELIF